MSKEYFNFALSDDDIQELKRFDSFEIAEKGFYLSDDDVDGIVDTIIFNGCESELANKIYDNRG